MAEGNRDVQVPLQDRTDELGQMAQAIDTLRRNAIQADATGQGALAEQQARAARGSALEKSARDLRPRSTPPWSGRATQRRNSESAGTTLTGAAEDGNAQADAVASATSVALENSPSGCHRDYATRRQHR